MFNAHIVSLNIAMCVFRNWWNPPLWWYKLRGLIDRLNSSSLDVSWLICHRCMYIQLGIYFKIKGHILYTLQQTINKLITIHFVCDAELKLCYQGYALISCTP